MKQVEVTIMGQGYVLGCPEGGEELLHAAVAEVDREMSGIRDAGRVKARERIAVLAALNLAYQLAEQRRESAAVTRAPRQEASAVNGAGGQADTCVDGIDLDALVQRLDRVLGDDGHLI